MLFLHPWRATQNVAACTVHRHSTCRKDMLQGSSNALHGCAQPLLSLSWPCSPSTHVQKKGWACRKEDLNALRAFKRRCASYDSCADLLFDEFLRAGLLIADGA